MSSQPPVAPWYRRVPWHVFAFMAPAVIIYSVFMIYPLFDSLRLSVLDDQGAFTGLDNYVRLLSDQNWAPRFFGAVSNNVIFFIIHMIVQNGVGLLLAAILTTRVLRGRNFYRTAIFVPTVLSVVIIGFAWQLILSPLWGIAEGFLGIFGLEDLYLPWLGLSGPALIVLSLISVWQFVGIPMLLFSAALLAISDEVLEAARVDGARAEDPQRSPTATRSRRSATRRWPNEGTSLSTCSIASWSPEALCWRCCCSLPWLPLHWLGSASSSAGSWASTSPSGS